MSNPFFTPRLSYATPFLFSYLGVPGLPDISEPSLKLQAKLLLKKSPTTKAKALSSLCEQLSSPPPFDYQFATFFAQIYPHLAIHNEKNVRSLSHRLCGLLVSSYQKNMSPFLPNIVPVWLLGQNDSDKVVVLETRKSLIHAFPEPKIAKLYKVFSTQIIEITQDFFQNESESLLTDPADTPKEEAALCYTRTASALVLLATCLDSTLLTALQSTLLAILPNQTTRAKSPLAHSILKLLTKTEPSDAAVFKLLYKFLKLVKSPDGHIQNANLILKVLLKLDFSKFSTDNLKKLSSALLAFFSGLGGVQRDFFVYYKLFLEKFPVFTDSWDDLKQYVSSPFVELRVVDRTSLSQRVSAFISFYERSLEKDLSNSLRIQILASELSSCDFSTDFLPLLLKIPELDLIEVVGAFQYKNVTRVTKLMARIPAAFSAWEQRIEPGTPDYVAFVLCVADGSLDVEKLSILTKFVENFQPNEEIFKKQCDILVKINKNTNIDVLLAVETILSSDRLDPQNTKSLLLSLNGLHSENILSYVRYHGEDIDLIMKYGSASDWLEAYQSSDAELFWRAFFSQRKPSFIHDVDVFINSCGNDRSEAILLLWEGFSSFAKPIFSYLESKIDENPGEKGQKSVATLYRDQAMACMGSLSVSDDLLAFLSSRIQYLMLSSEEVLSIYGAYFDWSRWIKIDALSLHMLQTEPQSLPGTEVSYTLFSLQKYLSLVSENLRQLSSAQLVSHFAFAYFISDAILVLTPEGEAKGDFSWSAEIDLVKAQMPEIIYKFSLELSQRMENTDESDIREKLTLFDEHAPRHVVEELCYMRAEQEVFERLFAGKQISYDTVYQLFKDKRYASILVLESLLKDESQFSESDYVKITKYIFSELLGKRKTPDGALLVLFTQFFSSDSAKQAINKRQLDMLVKVLEAWLESEECYESSFLPTRMAILQFFTQTLDSDLNTDYSAVLNDSLDIIQSGLDEKEFQLYTACFSDALELFSSLLANPSIMETYERDLFREEAETVELCIHVLQKDLNGFKLILAYFEGVDVKILEPFFDTLITLFYTKKDVPFAWDLNTHIYRVLNRILEHKQKEFLVEFALNYKSMMEDVSQIYGIPKPFLNQIGLTQSVLEHDNVDRTLVLLRTWQLVLERFFSPQLTTFLVEQVYSKQLPENAIEDLLNSIFSSKHLSLALDPFVGFKQNSTLPFSLTDYSEKDTKNALAQQNKLSLYYRNRDLNEETFLVVRIYYSVLLKAKSKAQRWYNLIRSLQLKQAIAQFTEKLISPAICDVVMDELSAKLENIDDSIAQEFGEEDYHKYKVVKASRELKSQYFIDEQNTEMSIRLPKAFPLESIIVDAPSRLGVKEAVWNSWILAVTSTINNSKAKASDAIFDGIRSFDRNMKLHFKGFEECSICYAILHAQDKLLPVKKCQTCKKQFHTGCLLKWFKSSGNNTCPLCRQEFSFRA